MMSNKLTFIGFTDHVVAVNQATNGYVYVGNR